MIDKQELPTSVVLQYICAMKYKNRKKLEMIASKGTEQPFNLDDMDEEDRERYIAHQHVSHFSDNKVLNNEINGMIVDIGTDIDWMASTERTISPAPISNTRETATSITTSDERR